MLKRLREETGCSIIDCKKALDVCDSYEMAYEYLRLKSQAVCRYKITNGKKEKWTDEDYIEKARQIPQDSSVG